MAGYASSSEKPAEKKPAEKKSAEKKPPELLVLVLTNGMAPADYTTCVDQLKDSSKSIGTHKRRELFWQAYSKLAGVAPGLAKTPQCFLMFRATPDDEGNYEDGAVEIQELTKRQRGLLGSIDLMGRKLKAGDDPKAWMMCWSEEEAQKAWGDLMSAEPCIYVSSDGVFVTTRYKRVLCKGLSGVPKTLKDVTALVSELAPENPLRSISFVGHDPPLVNGYNVVLTGQIDKALKSELPSTIGHTPTTSIIEIYDYFLQRRNGHFLEQAHRLIAQMLADVGKGLVPIIVAGSTKDASKAYVNALMKRVYVHESMTKFINRAREDGSVELTVIEGDVDDTEFGKYGKLVFELFYRVDLSTI